jgi:hypothetical protein
MVDIIELLSTCDGIALDISEDRISIETMRQLREELELRQLFGTFVRQMTTFLTLDSIHLYRIQTYLFELFLSQYP